MTCIISSLEEGNCALTGESRANDQETTKYYSRGQRKPIFLGMMYLCNKLLYVCKTLEDQMFKQWASVNIRNAVPRVFQLPAYPERAEG